MKGKIFLIDDEQDILEILSYKPRKEGCQVFTANNGNEGICKSQRNYPRFNLTRCNDARKKMG